MALLLHDPLGGIQHDLQGREQLLTVDELSNPDVGSRSGLLVQADGAQEVRSGRRGTVCTRCHRKKPLDEQVTVRVEGLPKWEVHHAANPVVWLARAVDHGESVDGQRDR